MRSNDLPVIMSFVELRHRSRRGWGRIFIVVFVVIAVRLFCPFVADMSIAIHVCSPLALPCSSLGAVDLRSCFLIRNIVFDVGRGGHKSLSLADIAVAVCLSG